MNNKKLWLIPLAVLPVFVSLGLVSGRLLDLQGLAWWVLQGGLALLGLSGGLILFFYLRARARAASASGAGAAVPAPDELERVLAAARQRIAAARPNGATRLADLPVVVVLGPTGSTKTTLVTHSGLDPELLAGEVQRGDATVPTPAANVWYAQGSVFLEAGGAMMQDAARWQRLVHQLRPDRLGAALGRKAQAPRRAVVCFACDELLRPDAAQRVPAAARELRARLVELSHGLGVRLPVYVLFTRADRVPFFTEYVRSFSRDESQEVLGTTLPVAEPPAAGTYADEQGRRLAGAFRELVHSLSLRRLDVLARESTEQARTGAYEFPRELRKTSDLAVEFLVELCKPSQLGESPFLRGFYFAGVRPVVVGETPPTPLSLTQAPQIALGATSVFNPRAAMQVPQEARSAGPRRVPEWAFVRRLFRDVLLQDRTAMRITESGTRVHGARRALLAAACLLLVVLGAGFTTSYVGNRSLLADVLVAARGAQGLHAAVAEAPEVPALQSLDALRVQASRLGALERDGHPLRLSWGLYTGDAVHPPTRTLYFDRFRRLLWEGTRADLVAALQYRAAAPDSAGEYSAVYDDLKAYLITTTYPEHSSEAFLAPALERHWVAGRGVDDLRRELARQQFGFFAAELPFGDPFGDSPNEALVASTRAFLARFASEDQLYQALLSEASRTNPSVRFTGGAGVASNPNEVPGAFTRGGWQVVNASLADVNRLFDRERWVAGERAVGSAESARLSASLRARYTADYIRHWQDFLRAGSLASGGGPADAAQRLTLLSGNQSPVLQLLALASQHTGVDTTAVAGAFQPLHQVISPQDRDKYINEANAGYVAALGGLQQALAQLATAQGPMQQQALGQATAATEQARGEVRQLASGFNAQGDAGIVAAQVQRLLESPLGGLDAMIGGVPSAGMNAMGQQFCADFRPLIAQYPFNPTGGPASLDDVAAVFMPGSSLLWTYYQDVLSEVLVRQGNRFAVRPSATAQPTTAFVEFFNRAARVSAALFNPDGSGPEVVFSFRPQTSDRLSEVTVGIDGQSQSFTRTLAASKTFAWNPTRPAPARITGRVNGSEIVLVEAPAGPWAVFRLFRDAEWQSLGGGRYLARWHIPALDGPFTAEISFARGEPVFMRDYLGGLGCVSQIVR